MRSHLHFKVKIFDDTFQLNLPYFSVITSLNRENTIAVYLVVCEKYPWNVSFSFSRSLLEVVNRPSEPTFPWPICLQSASCQRSQYFTRRDQIYHKNSHQTKIRNNNKWSSSWKSIECLLIQCNTEANLMPWEQIVSNARWYIRLILNSFPLFW